MSSVEKIINALSELENDIDGLSTKVQDLKKRILSRSEEEISKLREKVIEIAKKESEEIILNAKQEAEEVSKNILNEAENNLSSLKENIKIYFDKSVQLVIDSVLKNKEIEKD